jgi:hypothetical protein
VSILRGRSKVCVGEGINVGAKARLAGTGEPPIVFSFRRSRSDICGSGPVERAENAREGATLAVRWVR